MNDNVNFIERCISILKKEREIKSTAQAIDLLSIFILIRHLDVIGTLDGNIKDIDGCFDRSSIINFGWSVMNNNARNKFFEQNSGIEKIIRFGLDMASVRLSNNESCRCLAEIIGALKCEHDFFDISDDYNSAINRMFFESSQSGDFHTPKAISSMLISYLQPQENDLIFDPACGSSGLLLEANRYLSDKSKNESATFLCGMDASDFAFTISVTRFVLSGVYNYVLQLGDSLTCETEDKYDIVITNPPFGKIINQPIQNIENGNVFLDYAFLEKVMASLNENGKAAIILPERFLSDESSRAKEIRFRLINEFYLDCVLSMPSGAMLPSSAVKAVVLFFCRRKPSKEFWFYELNSVEKFTRGRLINDDDFCDFIFKSENKLESDNSFLILSGIFVDGFTIAKIKKSGAPYSDFTFFANSVDRLNELSGDVKSGVVCISKNIALISEEISLEVSGSIFREVVLGDIVRSVGTKPLSVDKLNLNGTYPVYGGNGIIGYNHEYLHSGECIVVGRVGALCGNVHYVNGNIWATNNAIVLKCKGSSEVNLSYLSKVLVNKNLHDLATGTAQPHIAVNKLMKLNLMLPPISIQNKLDHLLSQLDESIKQQNCLFDKLKIECLALHNKINEHVLLV
jgi:type I restriction enzyme M protein